MSIYFNRERLGVYSKASLSSPSNQSVRAGPNHSTESDDTDLTGAELDLFGSQSAASESALQSLSLVSDQDPVHVTRRVEEANAIADAQLSTPDRRVEFGVHKPSGRVTIKITETKNGAVVERELPPKAFLRLYERLRSAEQAGTDPLTRGSLIDFDG